MKRRRRIEVVRYSVTVVHELVNTKTRQEAAELIIDIDRSDQEALAPVSQPIDAPIVAEMARPRRGQRLRKLLRLKEPTRR